MQVCHGVSQTNSPFHMTRWSLVFPCSVQCLGMLSLTNQPILATELTHKSLSVWSCSHHFVSGLHCWSNHIRNSLKNLKRHGLAVLQHARFSDSLNFATSKLCMLTNLLASICVQMLTSPSHIRQGSTWNQPHLWHRQTRYGQPMQVWSGGTWTGESLFEVVWPWAEDLGHRSWYPCRGRSWWSGTWQLGGAAFRQGTRMHKDWPCKFPWKYACMAYWYCRCWHMQSWMICKILHFCKQHTVSYSFWTPWVGLNIPQLSWKWFGWLVPGLDEFHTCASLIARWAIQRADPCASPWVGPWAFENSWRPTAPSTAGPWKPLRPVAAEMLRMLRREMLADDSLNLVQSRSILFVSFLMSTRMDIWIYLNHVSHVRVQKS